MSLYRRDDSKFWWSRIEVEGNVHQFTTRTENKNVARQIESAKRTDLVRGNAGLTAPTLNTFTTRFINSLYGRVSKQTFQFYVDKWKALIEFPALSECKIDRIDAALLQDFITWRRKSVGT